MHANKLSPGRPWWLCLLLFALAYFAAAELGQWLSFQPSDFATFWPPSGLLVAVLLLSDPRDWPLLILSAFLANVTFDLWHSRPLWVSLLFASGNSLEAITGAWLVSRVLGHAPTLSSLKEALAFIILSALGSTMISATLGAAAVTLALGGSYEQTWGIWWTADVVGVLIVAPFILTWVKTDWRSWQRSGNKHLAQGALILGLLVIAALRIFTGSDPILSPREFLVLPLLVWATLRFDRRGATLYTLVFALIAIWGTTRGLGDFAVPGGSIAQQVIPLQAYLSVAAVTMLILAAVLAGHRQIEQSLRQRQAEFDAIFNAITDAIAFSDTQRRIVLINPAFTAMFGYTPEEVKGQSARLIYADDTGYEIMGRERFHVGATPQSPLFEMTYRRKDGSLFPAETIGAPVKDAQGSVIGFVGLHRDITGRKRTEEALRFLSARYEAILAAVPDIIMEVNADKVYTWANPAGFEFFGPDVLGKEVASYFVGAQETYLAVQPLFNGKEDTFYVESWQRRQDGESRLLAWWCRSLKDAAGNVIGALSTARDITERKQAEEALRASEARLRSIFGAAPVGIGLVSNRIILDANDRLCEMTGYSRDELIGKSARILYPTDEDYEYVGREKYQQIRERGTGTVETRFQRRDGSIIDVLLSSTPLDPADLAAGVTFTALDITERKRAEEKQRLISAQLQANLENTPNVAIQWYDETGRILYWNPASEAIYGWKSEEAVGKTLDALILTPEEATKFLQILRSIAATGQPVGPYETPIHRRDGRPGWVLSTTFAIPMGQDRTGFVCMDVDITGRKQAEEELKRRNQELAALHQETEAAYQKLQQTQMQLIQSAKLAAIGQLAAGVAHELNNPLTSILGFSELLLRDTPPEERAYRHLQTIITETQRARDIVRGLLNFSRQTESCRESVRVNLVLEETLALVRRLLTKDRITVVEEYAPDLPPLLLDTARMKQVFLNLITNARQAMPHRGTLTIRSRRIGDEVAVEIQDTGVGIPPENIPRLFEPFFTTQPVGQGTGLGLPISLGIVQDHGGRIEVESQVGVGSTFTVFLPVPEEERRA